MFNTSLPLTAPSPSTAPRLDAAVSGDNCRAVASLDAGANTRGDEPRQGQLAPTAGGAIQQPWQPQLPAQPQHGGHVPVGQGASHHERFVRGRQHHSALEHTADAFDEFRRQVGEVGEGFACGCACLLARLFATGWRGGCCGWG